jgi:hypothetical protein
VEQARGHHDPRKDLQRKHDLLHVGRVREDEGGGTDHALGEERVDDQSREEDQREARAVLRRDRPADVEHGAEHERVDRQHEERHAEGPEHPQHRATVARHHLATRQLPDDLAMAPEAERHGAWIGERDRPRLVGTVGDAIVILPRRHSLRTSPPAESADTSHRPGAFRPQVRFAPTHTRAVHPPRARVPRMPRRLRRPRHGSRRTTTATHSHPDPRRSLGSEDLVVAAASAAEATAAAATATVTVTAAARRHHRSARAPR